MPSGKSGPSLCIGIFGTDRCCRGSRRATDFLADKNATREIKRRGSMRKAAHWLTLFRASIILSVANGMQAQGTSGSLAYCRGIYDKRQCVGPR